MMDSRKKYASAARTGCTCGRTENRCSVNTCAVNACAANTTMQPVPVMVYIVDQGWECVYLPCRALAQGTLFPALDKPFFGKGGCSCD